MLYLDDHFPEHPKIAEAGGDAGWLWISAACWVKRHKTGGRVPKAVVPRLSDRRQPLKLAARLVEVGLWHEDGSDFVFHEWVEHNWSESRAKKAAHARWGSAGGDAQASASIVLEGRSADAPASGRAHAPRPPTSSSSSSTHVGGSTGGDDDDRFASTYSLLADRRIGALGSPPTKPRAYRRTVLADVTREHADRIGSLVAEMPGLTPLELADMLEPPTGPPPASAEEVSIRARRERDVLLAARDATPCLDCDGGWRMVDGAAVACSSCSRTGVAAHA